MMAKTDLLSLGLDLDRSLREWAFTESPRIWKEIMADMKRPTETSGDWEEYARYLEDIIWKNPPRSAKEIGTTFQYIVADRVGHIGIRIFDCSEDDFKAIKQRWLAIGVRAAARVIQDEVE